MAHSPPLKFRVEPINNAWKFLEDYSLIDSCLGLLLNSRCTTIHLSLVGGSLLTTNSTLIGLITAENNGPNADNNGPNSTMKLRNAWTGSVCTYIYINSIYAER